MEKIERRNLVKFIHYPNCSTCKKAKQWLMEHNISFTEQNIKENPPTLEELKHYSTLTDKPLNKFFNTSGLKYKELNLKDKMPTLSDEEKLELLSSDGMLIKRPLLVGDDFILIGFRPQEWEQTLRRKENE